MGTRGYIAYRYKKRYFRCYTNNDSYPECQGNSFAGIIPRSSARREAWLTLLAKSLEETILYIQFSRSRANKGKAYENKDPNAKVLHGFCDLADDNEWMTNDVFIEWTYVIDLDYRAFTVNGIVHFNLDNMPPRRPGIAAFFEGDTIKHVPEKYLTTVSQWPNPRMDIEATLQEYDHLRPLVIKSLEEWGAPSWKSLSLPQHLSVELVKTIVSDHKDILSRPDLAGNRSVLALSCWQIACAAAPSNLLCPAITAHSLPEAAIYAHIMGRYNSNQIVPYYVGGENLMHTYCWFRGCLVVFCPRIDEDAYMKLEVSRMTGRLREKGRIGGIGIIISSNQLVAVAVNGHEVRHSPVLDIHDSNDSVKDGLLLLVHMLSPVLAAQKTPWNSVAGSMVSSVTASLPIELVHRIAHLTDDDTYHFILPLVSRTFRSICLDHPRIGDHVLLGVDSGSNFNVLRRVGFSAVEGRATLTRTDEQNLLSRLAGTFHHRQSPQAEINSSPELAKKPSKAHSGGGRGGRIPWKTIVNGEDSPEKRIQVVKGIWTMVEVDIKGSENIVELSTGDAGGDAGLGVTE